MTDGPGNRSTRELSSVGSTLDELFGFAARADTWLDVARQATLPPPALGKLGPYELIEELGQGGQGSVYRARQPGTSRDVAIKVLGVGGSRFKDRFAREVEALTRLNHPNVVTVFSAEIVENHPILVMELVAGAPIDDWVCNSRPSLSELLNTFVAACAGVAHAHQRGVIHRDLKPSNVLVTPDGLVKVVDFGIAKLVESDSSDPGLESTRTTAGFVGTPAFAPPEVIDRTDARPDTRSDVFSLGVLLYLLLTRSEPFERTGSLLARLDHIRRGPRRRPSASADSLPQELDWIVLKALAFEPDQRYQSVDALGEDLRRFLRGEAILAHPPSALYQVRAFARRHKPLIAGVLILITTLAVTSIITWSASVRAARALETSQASLAREQAALKATEQSLAREEAARKTAEQALANEEVARKAAETEAAKHVDLFSVMKLIFSTGDLNGPNGQARATIREGIEYAANFINDRPGFWKPVNEAFLRHAIGEIYLGNGLPEKAETQFQKAVDLRTELFGRNHRETLSSLHFLARVHRQLGRLEDAIAVQQAVIEARRVLDGNESPYLAQALNSQGVNLRRAHDEATAEFYFREAIAIYLQNFGERDDNTAPVLSGLGMCLFMQGCLDEAEAATRKAITLAEKFSGGTQMDNSLYRTNLARILRAKGEFIEAERQARESVDLAVFIAGVGSPRTADSLAMLADTLIEMGRPHEAIEPAESCLSVLESSPSSDQEKLQAARDRLARLK